MFRLNMLPLITDGIPSPPMIMVRNITATSITLAWDQPGGPDVDSYDIDYNYIIDECGNVRNQAVSVTVSNTSQRSYVLLDTPVEEDSRYSISITARNSVGRSAPAIVQIITPEAGICCI